MKKLHLLKTMLLLCALIVGSGTMWADDPVTLVSGSGTSGYTVPTGWTSSGTVEGGSYLKFDNGTITSPEFAPHTGLSFTYTVATFGSGTNHPLTIRILNASTDAVIVEKTTSTPTSSSYISTGSPLSLGDVDVAFKIQLYAPSGKGIRLRNYSVTGTPNAAKTDPTITFSNGSVRVGQNLDLSTLFTSNSAGSVTYSITAGDSYASLVGSTLTGVAEGSVTVKAAQETAGNYNAGEATSTITVNPALALSSIAITTPPTKTTYTEGETFDPTGMVVTATYSDASTGDVTASCTFSPSTALTTSDTEITVSYTENAVEKTTTQAITVNAYVQPTSFDINFNDTFFGTSYGGTASGITDSNPETGTLNNVTVTYAGSGNHYINDSQIRFYPSNKLTFEAPSGYNITKIVFTSGGTWAATISANVGTYTSGTKTWTGEATSVLFTGSGSSRCDMSKAAITLAKGKELSSIAVSGTYPTVFEVGDAFSHEGAVVTATYDDASEAVVTASAVFSTPDMSSAGVKTVTVSYIENAVEKTTTYDINVKVPATLESIALSGTYPTTFNVGDEFSHEGMTVTANFDDETNADVTALATFTGYDMSVAGVQTVTVSYTHKGVTTKTKTYDITVNTVAVSSVTVAPTSATVKIGKTVTLTPTISPDNATNKNVTWESNNTSVATVDGGVVTGVAAGEATITVKSAADPTKSASCTITVIEAGDGSKAKPFDVAEAIEYIDGEVDLTGKYVKGIIAKIDNCNAGGKAQYWISDDGVTEDQFEVYSGYYYGGANFATAEDIKVGDNVIVYGNLTYYAKNSVYEFAKDNYIYSLNGVKIPEITFGEASYEVAYNGSLTITATADGNGAITYSSSDETVAEINSTTGVVTPHKAGEVTITANIAASANNIAGSKEVTLTVTDGRASAGIEFAEATITKTWGEAFTGQELTNPNSLTVAYASSDEAVASVVAATGVVTVNKAGTATITATFAGNEDYMSAEVSYTLTVNKAAAGLSFTTTAYDFDLNDDSFTGVAVNNPNSLAVTYESSNEDIAVIGDEETGELALDASAEGTVTITASFAGNDWFNAGNASYTITITDPDRKGTKKNPYTVAEVIAGTATGSDIYVRGFIVGRYVGSSTAPQTSGFSDNGNVALADEFTNSPAASSSVPCQLSTDALKNAWGCKATNGSLLGYEVLIKGDVTSYFSVTGIKNTDEVSAVSVPAKFNASGYATFASTYALDFSDDSEFSAWQITGVSGSAITFGQITGTVAAGTGVLLKGTASSTVNIPVAASGSDISGTNKLVGITSATAVAADTYYGLSGNVFKKVNAGTVPAGKALLPASEVVSAHELKFVFEDDETTGISTSLNAKGQMTNDKVVYNLNGQRVAEPKKGGLYIVNGRKVVVK